LPIFTSIFPYDILYPQSAYSDFLEETMNFEIIVRSNKDGRFIVACPNFPNCESEGASLEEAMEGIIEKIADHITCNIKNGLKDALREISKKAPAKGKGPFEFSGVLTKFPISLN
jgi:predicted RNase H-like HicB family nuclease